jgi:hypothetical protein
LIEAIALDSQDYVQRHQPHNQEYRKQMSAEQCRDAYRERERDGLTGFLFDLGDACLAIRISCSCFLQDLSARMWLVTQV